MIISLIGFMGVGKSTITKGLSQQLLCPFIDLDRYIEEREGGTPLVQLFEKEGEEYFRKIEERTLEQLLKENREKVLLLSLGGGTLLSQKNREIIKELTYPIYLRSSVETLVLRLKRSRQIRPLIKETPPHLLKERIEQLYFQRQEGYIEVAKAVVDVDGLSPQKVIKSIVELLR